MSHVNTRHCCLAGTLSVSKNHLGQAQQQLQQQAHSQLLQAAHGTPLGRQGSSQAVVEQVAAAGWARGASGLGVSISSHA